MSEAPDMETRVLNKILERHPKGEAKNLIHLLQDIQAEFNWLPQESIRAVAVHLSVPLTKVYSVATFYKALSLKPRGKKIIKICMGTSCHIRGSSIIVEDIHQGLGIGPGETTKDLAYTAEVVNCVGACALAPVVIADDNYLAKVRPGTILTLLNKN